MSGKTALIPPKNYQLVRLTQNETQSLKFGIFYHCFENNYQEQRMTIKSAVHGL